MQQVLEIAKNLQFRDGNNKIGGYIAEFEIKLTDTYFQNIDLDSNVESCFNR